MAGDFTRFNAFAEFQTVDLGHGYVAHHQIGHALEGFVPSGFAVGRHPHIVVGQQELCHIFSHFLIVIHHEHLRFSAAVFRIDEPLDEQFVFHSSALSHAVHFGDGAYFCFEGESCGRYFGGFFLACRQKDRKGAALAGMAGGVHRASLRFGISLDNGQTDPRTTRRIVGSLKKTIEDVR